MYFYIKVGGYGEEIKIFQAGLKIFGVDVCFMSSFRFEIDLFDWVIVSDLNLISGRIKGFITEVIFDS